jgi:hypothetical protein
MRSSTNREMARKGDKTRFPSVVVSNINRGLSRKNMEVMSTNPCKTVQHREQ